MRIVLWMFSVASLWAQLGSPVIGKMLDARGALRTVRGIPGSTTVGDVEIPDVISAACGVQFCLAKTKDSLVSPTGSIPVPAGGARIAISGTSAIIYFERSKQLMRWRNDRLTHIEAQIDGDVLAIRESNGRIELALRKDGLTWIAGADGAIFDFIPAGRGPVMLTEGSLLFTAREGLVLRRQNSVDQVFPLNGIEALSALSDDYIEVRAWSGTMALRLSTGHMFQLPEMEP